jgi:hypothetical protein
MRRDSASVRHLEEVQAAALMRAGLDADKRNADADRGFLASAEQGFQSVRPDHPGPAVLWAAERLEELHQIARTKGMSRLDYFPTFSILAELIVELEDAAGRLGLTIDPQPTIGTAPIPEINARTFKVPRSRRHVVVVNEDLFSFCLLMAKAVVEAFSIRVADDTVTLSRDIDGVGEKIRSIPAPLEHFQRAFIPFVMIGNSSSAPQYFIIDSRAHLAHIVWSSMELFAIGHEYGHVLANHLVGGKSEASFVGRLAVQEFRPSQEQELEADRLSLPVLIEAMRGRGADVSMAYVGADLFFSLVDLYGRAISVVTSGSEDHDPRSGTHPSAEMRREALRSQLGQVGLTRKEVHSATELADRFCKVLELYWDCTRDFLLDAHTVGLRPGRVKARPLQQRLTEWRLGGPCAPLFDRSMLFASKGEEH